VTGSENLPRPPAESEPAPLLRILVVEDSRLNALALTHLLAPRSCVLHCAANGHEALDCLRRNDYDVVLMDLDMPEMDGVQAAAAIRRGEAGSAARDIPIMGIAAHGADLDGPGCSRAGVDGFVPRPFAPETLSAAIREALGQRRSRD